MRAAGSILSLIASLLFSSVLLADDMRPASLTIEAINDSSYEISWLVPTKNGVRPPLSVEFDGTSTPLTPKRTLQQNNTSREYWRIENKQNLLGSTITIVGLKGSTYEVLLRIIDQQKHTITAVLNTEQPDYTIPDIKTIKADNTVITYVALGIEHIFIGLDHLLFVGCLVYFSGT
jgi:hypothetical protein